MARFRRTLALIILSIGILATVITAFKVRDLPKGLQDSLKSELLKKHKCLDCEVNGVKDGQKHSAKIESVNRYEELKKAVRDKQQQISMKSPNKPSFKFLDDDDDEGDDGESFAKKIPSSKEVVKNSNENSDPQKFTRTSKKPLVDSADDDNDDDEDDHDDDDDDDDTSNTKIKMITELKKSKPSVLNVKKTDSKIRKIGNNSDEDDEDDDDDSFDEKGKTVKNKQKNTSIKQTDTVKTSLQIKKTAKLTPQKASIKNKNDQDDDDDDDDDDDILFTKKTLKPSEIIRDKEVEPEPEPKQVNNKIVKKNIVNLDDDDDDDDDNDHKKMPKNPFSKPQETQSKATNTKSIEKSSKSSKESKSKEKLETKVVSKEYSNDDDDDDDDDNEEDNETSENSGGFFGGLFSTVSKLTAELVQNDEEPVTKTIKEQKAISQPKPTKKETEKKQVTPEKTKEKAKENIVRTAAKKVEPVKKESKTPVKQQVEDKKSVQKEEPKKPQSKIIDETPKEVQIQVKKEEAKTPQTKHKEETPKEPVKKQKEPEKEQNKQKSNIKDAKSSHEENKKDKPKENKDKSKIPNVKPSTKEKIENSAEMLVDEVRKESHLKDVSEALHRRNLLQSEFEDYYAFFPTFAPNFSRIHNPECRRHGQILLRQLRGTKLWALNMLDATAKIPSGILQGNGIQFGDFDQCLACRARVQLDTGSVVKIHGKYCLARLEVKAEDPELDLPVHLAQAKNLIRSKIDDPGHFVPRFSTLSWGICIPSACSPEDVEVVIKDAVKHYQHKSGVVLRVKVDEEDCQTDEGDWIDDWLELPTILTLLLYAIILLLVILATAKDYLARRKSAGDGAEGDSGDGEEKGESEEKGDGDDEPKQDENEGKDDKQKAGIFNAFSLYNTLDKLFAPGSADDISCIHGIRGLATIALLIVHKMLPVASTPFTNRVKIAEVVTSWTWSWLRAGWMYTDCFLLLSGVLTAHRITAGDGSAPKRLFSRYLRLTPALLAVVLFYAFVWDKINSGPMWGTLVTRNADICRDGWWWNLFYVQNWFGFEDMCAPQTHQLALDMQLTILAGVIVWMVQLEHWSARLLVPGLHILAAYSRYSTVLEHRLTLLVYNGVTVSQLYRTARLSYTSVLHRSTAYLVGLSLGLLLRNPGENGQMVRIIGWITASCLWCLVWWAGMDSGSPSYHYSASYLAQYAALAPIAAALAVAWVIYAVHTGGDGFLSTMLSSKPLVLISRLSYAIYLCQFIVYFTNAATIRSSAEFTLLSLIDVKEISTIFLLSTVLTVTFVFPMQSFHKIFFRSSESSESEDKQEANEKEAHELELDKQPLPKIEEEENEPLIEEVIEIPQIRRQVLVAHREVLEEIPETELEFEMQREKDDGLEEILEEEEDEMGEEEIENLEEGDLEVIEEEGGEDDIDFWEGREEDVPRRSFSRADDRDLDEWEWTNESNERNGGQYSRYTR